MRASVKTAYVIFLTGMHGIAFAQSSVSIYGVVDAFLRNTKSGGEGKTYMSEGGNGATRLGFRGTEDLGGGNKVRFLMEMGINPTNGQGTVPGPTAAFTRQSYLNISGNWGGLELGRMYTPLFLTLAKADAFGMNALFSPIHALATVDAQTGLSPYASRSSNMFRYHFPRWGGISSSLAVASGDSDPAIKNRSRLYGGNIGWDSKSFSIGYGFQIYKNALKYSDLKEPPQIESPSDHSNLFAGGINDLRYICQSFR